MTQEQLASARATVAGLLQSQRTIEDVPASVEESIDTELAYLANANPDPISEEELEGLVGHIVSTRLTAASNERLAAAAVSTIVDDTPPASTIIDTVPAGPVVTELPPVSPIVMDVKVTADYDNGLVLFDAAGVDPIRCTLQAAAEAVAGFAMALDELLTPGPGYEWEDASFESAFLHDQNNDRVAAEIHRDENGGYAVTVRTGVDNPEGLVVGGGSSLESAKFIAVKFVRATIPGSGIPMGSDSPAGPGPELPPELPPAA
jgi:hypothetical protein